MFDDKMFEAALKTADLIEKHPHKYDFNRCGIPGPGAHETGCLWGWMGHFSGHPMDVHIAHVAMKAHMELGVLYATMEATQRAGMLDPHWQDHAPTAARVLREVVTRMKEQRVRDVQHELEY